jgi:ribonucleoside-diphosphate reductase beta chain
MPITPLQARSKYFDLYANSKRLAWDPATIDLAADRTQWQEIRRDHPVEQYAEQIHHLCSLFYQGEESVTMTLAPFLSAVARGNLGIDKEMFLTSQIYEEAKHFEFFHRYFTDVIGDGGDSTYRHMTAAPQAVLVDDLNDVADRMRREDDPERLRAVFVEGVTHYMGVVEAMLARTGYIGANDGLASRGWLPGLQEGFRLIRRDEGRHVSFGMHCLAELTADRPDYRDIVRETFERHLPNVIATVASFDYPHPIVDIAKLQDYAIAQYERFASAAGLTEVTVSFDEDE